MKEVFVVSALRTPFGSFGGALADLGAPELAARVIGRLMVNSPLTGEQIDEVIIGQVLQGGAAQAPARQAMRLAGLPDSVHAMTINKVCGSGLKAIMLAAPTPFNLGMPTSSLPAAWRTCPWPPTFCPKPASASGWATANCSTY